MLSNVLPRVLFEYLWTFITEHSVILSAILVASALYFIYRKTRRMTRVADLPRNLKNCQFRALVTRVGDGDGFRAVHVPLLLSAVAPPNVEPFSIRLAGVDAPEMRSFGRPEQKFASEAKAALEKLVLGKTVSLDVLDIDQYGRLVAMVHVRRYFIWTLNVNLEMVRRGLASIYTGARASFGGIREELETAERAAREARRGIWSDGSFVEPKHWRHTPVK